MDVNKILEAVRTLPPEDQLRMADEIWNNLRNVDFTDEQRELIDRRLTAFETHGRVVTWDEFNLAARARWGR